MGMVKQNILNSLHQCLYRHFSMGCYTLMRIINGRLGSYIMINISPNGRLWGIQIWHVRKVEFVVILTKTNDKKVKINRIKAFLKHYI
jgi:uncharacterized protein YuzE